jgi:hypothetical protein
VAPLNGGTPAGVSCWIERLHPGTRSCTDLATFCLSGRAHDPKEIRKEAVLEIVEQLPAHDPMMPPVTRILTYPIPIRLISAMIDEDAVDVGGQALGHGGSDDAGRDGNGNQVLGTNAHAVVDASGGAQTMLPMAARSAWPSTPLAGDGTEPAVLTGSHATPTGLPSAGGRPLMRSSPETILLLLGIPVGPTAIAAGQKEQKEGLPKEHNRPRSCK